MVDQVLETPSITITESHVSLFRGLTRDIEDGGDVVPPLLPLCLSTGLAWRIPQPPLVVLAFMGLEWQALRDVHVGDTVRSRSTTRTKRSMRDGGIIIEERDIVDQTGAVVQRGRLTLLIAKRPAEGA